MSFSRLCNFLFVLYIARNALMLYAFGSEEMDLAIGYIENLTKVSRFDILIMCLSSAEKDGKYTSTNLLWSCIIYIIFYTAF